MSMLRSTDAFLEAELFIPGGVNSPVRAFKGVIGVPPFIAKGEGAYIYDIDGNRYIDYVQSWGPLIFGHCDKDIENSVIEALKNGLSFGAPTELETKLAREIVKLIPQIDKIRFVSSGTEAVMSAIRLARAYSGKDDIIKFEGCYHGHSDSLLVQAGSGAATFGNPSSPGVPKDLVKHTLLAKYNDLESVENCFRDSGNVGVVIIEPIAGNMGLVPADIEFLQALRSLCDKFGAVLIFDEVMSGFRASLKGSYPYHKVEADLLTFGKVIGGGMPVGAFGGRDEVMNLLSPKGSVYQAGTLSGNPVAMSAGIASIKKLIANPKIYDELEIRAKKLVEGLKSSANSEGYSMVIDVRGSMFGFFLNDNVVKNFDDAKKSNLKLFAKFHKAMLDKGVYLACSQFEAGFISTAITDEMISYTVAMAKEAFREIRIEELENGGE